MASPNVSSLPLRNLSCARCHATEGALGRELQPCTACKNIHYCSHECQEGDEQDHKAGCDAMRKLESGDQPKQAGPFATGPSGDGGGTSPPARTRTKIRIDTLAYIKAMNGELSADYDANDGIIYYLKTSTPHLHDITIWGPFETIEAVAAQMHRSFGSECPDGHKTVDQLLADNQLIFVGHVSSPINNDLNKIKTCRILKENNPGMKKLLPGPSWRVFSMDVDTDALEQTSATASFVERRAVRDADIQGTFASEEAAIERAKQTAKAVARSVENGSVLVLGHEHHGSVGKFVAGRPPFTSGLLTFVGIKYNDGGR